MLGSKFLRGLINPEDRERDVKLLAFGMVAVFGVVKLGLSPIDANWVNAFYGLCALVGLGGTAWAAVDKWKSTNVGVAASPATPDTTARTASGSEGSAQIGGQE